MQTKVELYMKLLCSSLWHHGTDYQDLEGTGKYMHSIDWWNKLIIKKSMPIAKPF